MIFLVASLIGTASPSPMPATAVFTPTTRLSPSASAPPELPGLSAASVWITFSTSRPADPDRVGSDLPRAETTPAVTVPASPIGLPIATTSWPTRSIAELGRLQVARVGANDRQVGQGIGSDHLGADLPPVREGGAHAMSASDDVGGGEHVAVGGDGDAGASALGAATAGPARDGQVRDGLRQALGNARDGPRVGVESVGVGEAIRRSRGGAVADAIDQLEPGH